MYRRVYCAWLDGVRCRKPKGGAGPKCFAVKYGWPECKEPASAPNTKTQSDGK